MSDYGLEVRDADGNIIIDSSTFTVRQVAKRFISSSNLIAKVGRDEYTGAVDFPWAESKYGMFVSVTQLGLSVYPRSHLDSELTKRTAKDMEAYRDKDELGLNYWINRTPRLPVVTAYDGFIRMAPAVSTFNANVWLSLYVVV